MEFLLQRITVASKNKLSIAIKNTYKLLRWNDSRYDEKIKCDGSILSVALFSLICETLRPDFGNLLYWRDIRNISIKKTEPSRKISAKLSMKDQLFLCLYDCGLVFLLKYVDSFFQNRPLQKFST